MGTRNLGIAALCFLLAGSGAQAMTDAQVRQAIIQDSIGSYPGPCACPYNTDRRGHACGRRSAYSRPGGYAPVCYPEQITPEMVRDYRGQHLD
jgi:hypothetical protein